jgi:choline dehydrogenase-like flavoprotein
MQDGRRVVVIGSGPAGAMAAWELVREGVPVTMLESGTAEPGGLLVRALGRNLFRHTPPVSSPAGDFVAGGDPNTIWLSHLAPGGLSNQWTGAVPRFAPADFTEGERIDERYRWPLRYDELAPFYADAERLLHVTGAPDAFSALPAGCLRHRRRLPATWQRIARTALGHGQGLTVLPLADGPTWLIARRATAFNSYTNIVRPLLPSPHFELRLGAHALRLEWSGRARRVDAVTYHDRATGSTHSLPAAGVVVACGALRSTKLLFDSACPDFPEGIGNTEGLLGKYFHDHPREWWTFETDESVERLSPAAYLTRRAYDESPPLLATSWTIGVASLKDKLLALTPMRSHVFGVQVFGSMRPDEDRFVRPHPARTDEFGLPQLKLSIEFSADEVDNVIASRQRLIDLLADAGLAARLHPVVPQLVPGGAVHYGGTVRMHDSPRHGVVNRWNRPFDVPNVVVSDASCFTTNSEKNPTLTAMALSARAGRRLADDLKAG